MTVYLQTAARASDAPMSEAERKARVELAACYRVFDLLGWTELIFNHITVRVPGAGAEAAQAKALEIAQKVAGVSSVEPREASEAGADIATISVRGEGDLRDALCRALVQADVSVLSLGREQELESMFLELLGETGEGAPVRRKKKRRKDGEAAASSEGGAA